MSIESEFWNNNNKNNSVIRYKNNKGEIVKGKFSDDEEDLIYDRSDISIKFCEKCENKLESDDFCKACDDKSLAFYIQKQKTMKKYDMKSIADRIIVTKELINKNKAKKKW